MNPPRKSAALALLLAIVACLAGCPGYLDNPERFVGGGADSGAPSCLIGVDNVEVQLIRPRCATSNCHDRGGRSGGLDLESPDVAARLLGVPSHCGGQALLVPGAGAGHLLDKLGVAPGCGARMPQGAPALSASDVTCVRLWAASLRLDAGAPMDVPARDVAVDVAPDARPTDVAADRPADVASDARADASDVVDATDDATDVVTDATPDDATTDAGVDAAMDAVTIDASDATTGDDVARDAAAPRDTAPPRDAGADVGADAIADLGPDAGDARDAGAE